MSDGIAVGNRFTVSEKSKPHEVRDERNRVLARYLPGYTYAVTGKNMEIVKQLITEKRAVIGGKSLSERVGGIALKASDGKVKAKVSIKKGTK